MIKGKKIVLRPAILKDCRVIFEWANDSDIAPLIHISDNASETFEEFYQDWKEYFFTDYSLEL